MVVRTQSRGGERLPHVTPSRDQPGASVALSGAPSWEYSEMLVRQSKLFDSSFYFFSNLSVFFAAYIMANCA